MKREICYALTTIVLLIIAALPQGCAAPPPEGESGSEGDDVTTASLPWTGQTEKFTINAQEGVRLSDPAKEGGTAYVSFASNALARTCWKMGVRLTFNPSNNNYARFFLAASSGVLADAPDGYFVQIGGAKDNVGLYRQADGQSTLLVSGRELMKGIESPKIYIEIARDDDGHWTLRTRTEAEPEYTLEGEAADNLPFEPVACGVYCVYTKSRCDGFAFHHIQITHDVAAHEPGEEEPGEEEPGSPAPLSPSLPDEVKGLLLFNEVMYDPDADGAEYVEIYNPSEEPLLVPALYLYKMKEDGKVYSTTALWEGQAKGKPIVFPPRGYLCFSKRPDRLAARHEADEERLMEVPAFPALNNTDGGLLALSLVQVPATGKTFDKCRFNNGMHDVGKGKTFKGLSLEKVSPELPSAASANWRSSKDPSGGSPGRKNP